MPTATNLPSGYRFAPLQPGTPAFDEAVRLYLAIWPGESEGIADFFTRYAALPGYHGLVALDSEGALVGFGFGTRSLPGNWWHDHVAAQVGAEHPALQDAWALVDLAVTPEERGKGIGAALLETLLAEQPCPRALLSTEVSNAGARRLYERHGWSYLHPGFVFTPGAQPFVVMRRELAICGDGEAGGQRAIDLHGGRASQMRARERDAAAYRATRGREAGDGGRGWQHRRRACARIVVQRPRRWLVVCLSLRALHGTAQVLCAV